MHARPSSVVGVLIQQYPGVVEVLAGFGIQLAGKEHDRTLAQLAAAARVDLEDLLIDVQSVLDEAEGDPTTDRAEDTGSWEDEVEDDGAWDEGSDWKD
jgi:hypothetical protein